VRRPSIYLLRSFGRENGGRDCWAAITARCYQRRGEGAAEGGPRPQGGCRRAGPGTATAQRKHDRRWGRRRMRSPYPRSWGSSVWSCSRICRRSAHCKNLVFRVRPSIAGMTASLPVASRRWKIAGPGRSGSVITFPRKRAHPEPRREQGGEGSALVSLSWITTRVVRIRRISEARIQLFHQSANGGTSL
jgi:hypothetical protein